MCGRFTLHSPKQRIVQQYGAQIPFDFEPNYNIGPGQSVIALFPNEDFSKISGEQILWGIQPKWSETKSKLLINARCETVHEKSTFKSAFKANRCVFIADGWFEWQRINGLKKPFLFRRKDTRLLAFAGLAFGEDKEKKGIVLTRNAPSQIADIHDRSPLLLSREQVNVWLSKASFSCISENAINAFDTSILEHFPVNPKVNAIRNNTIDNIHRWNGL